MPSIKNGEFILADCLDVMEHMQNQSVDMVITSPPYDELRSYEKKLEWSFQIFEKIAQEISRILEKGGVLVWVVNDQVIKGSESGTSFRQALFFKDECGLNLHDTMIYMKDNPPPVGGSNRYYQTFEYMFVFSKGKPRVFNPLKTERRNKYNDKRTKRTKSFTRNRDGDFIKKEVALDFSSPVKRRNVFTYTVGGGNSVDYNVKHPAAFPLELAKDQILSWSNKGDLIFDPMAGSGTVAIAAEKTCRKWICIEKEASYFNPAVEKIMSMKSEGCGNHDPS